MDSKYLHTTVDTVNLIDDVSQITKVTSKHDANPIGMEDERIRTIIDFLKRPESFKSIPLSNTMVQGSQLAIFDIPNDILPQMKRDKIVGFKNFRADVNLHIRVNTNPMACGKIIIGYYVPNMFNSAQAGQWLGNGFSMLNSLTSMTACPHVEIDLASGEAIDFVIPYVNVTSHWDLTQVDPSVPALSKYPQTLVVFVYAYTDISIPSGVASLQLFVGLDNVDLSYPTYPTRELAGARARIIEDLTSNGLDIEQATRVSKMIRRDVYQQQGLLSDIAGVVGKVSSVLSPITSEIPVLGSVVNIAGAVSKPVQVIASALGYSKNLSNDEPCIFEQSLNRYAQNIDGVDTSRIFALSHANRLENDSNICLMSEDEMSFAYIFSKPEFFQTFYWDAATQFAGAKLTSFKVDPMICDKKFGRVDFPATQAQPASDILVPTHLAYLSHMFYYWRGSLKYTIKFAKTAFHVGRVRIMWLPGDQDPTYDPQVTYDANSPEAAYFIQQIVDLRDTNEIVFTVPFSSNRPFNLCVGADEASLTHPDYSTNGTVLIQALTDLSAPSSVVQKIQAVIEISAGDDFELAVFKGNPWFVPEAGPKLVSHLNIGTLSHGQVDSVGSLQSVETYGGIHSTNVGESSAPASHVIVDNVVTTSISNTPLAVNLATSTTLPVSVENQPTVKINGTVFTAATGVTPVQLQSISNGVVSHTIVDSGQIDATVSGTVSSNRWIAEEDSIVFYNTTQLLSGNNGPLCWIYVPRGEYIPHEAEDFLSSSGANELFLSGISGDYYLENRSYVYTVQNLPNITGAFDYFIQSNYKFENQPYFPTDLASALAIGNISGALADSVLFVDINDDGQLGEWKKGTKFTYAVFSNARTGDWMGRGKQWPASGPVFGQGFQVIQKDGLYTERSAIPSSVLYSEPVAIDGAVTVKNTLTTPLHVQIVPVDEFTQQSSLTVADNSQLVEEKVTSQNLLDASSVSMGERILSVRAMTKVFQLNSIMTARRGTVANSVWNPDGFSVMPQMMMPYFSTASVSSIRPGYSGGQFTDTEHDLSVSQHAPDIIDAMSLMYGFWKGSLRGKFQQRNGGFATADVVYRPSTFCKVTGTTFPETHDLNGFNTPIFPYVEDRWKANDGCSTASFAPSLIDMSQHAIPVANDVEARNLQIQFPYYTPLVMTRVAGGIQFDGTTLYDADKKAWFMPQNIYKVQYRHGKNGDPFSERKLQVAYYRAAADDFRFHLLQGIPPISRTKSSLMGGVAARSISSVNTSTSVGEILG